MAFRVQEHVGPVEEREVRLRPRHRVVQGVGPVLECDSHLAWPDYGVFLEFDGKEKYLRYRRPGESVIDTVLREKRREKLLAGRWT